MNISMMVDSGASRDALPLQFFLAGSVSLRETALSSSNGLAKGLVYKHNTTPRLGRGAAQPETRDVLAINGPMDADLWM